MKITEFAVRNYQFTIIIFVMVLLLGLNALFTMPRGEDPVFSAPIFVVLAVYPGASPNDMEELLADPIEDAVAELDDVKKIVTNCDDGLMLLRLEFTYGVDIDAKNNDVIREVNKLRSSLPQDLALLEVQRASSADVAILQTAITSSTASYEEMKIVAEDLKKRLEKVRDLKEVEIQAYPDRQIEVEVNLEKMAQNQVGLNQVLNFIEASNINIPGGDLNIGAKKFNITTNSSLKNLDDIRNIIVKPTAEGRVVYLRDIASVKYGEEDISHKARFNGERAVWVITKLKDLKNIIQSNEKVQPIFADFQKRLPQNMSMQQGFDQPENVKRRLGGLGKDFAIAIFLVLLTLVPLGFRASLVVMISIPLSLSIGVAILSWAGFSLNQLSIVGLVVSLGLLVDDSIVIVENIERFLRMGYDRKKAAIVATKQISVAVLGCTATLILAFLPLAFLPEGSGQFIRSLPVALISTIFASLFVAITIIPFLSSIMLKKHEQSEGNFFLRAFKRYINDPYHKVLIWAFKHPILTLLGTFLIFMASLTLVPSIGFSLFPMSEKPMFNVNINMPLGTSIEETDRMTRKVEAELFQHPQVQKVSANVGKGNPRVYYNELQKENAANYSQLFVQVDPALHVPEITALVDTLRERFADYPGVDIQVQRFQQGPPTDAPIEMRILGPNLDTLNKLAFVAENIMKSVEGTVYVTNPLRTKKTDLKVMINKDKAGLLGLPMAEIAKTIRMGIAGLDVSNFRTDEGEEYKINVSVAKTEKEALEVFSRIYLTSLSGALIPLNQVAKLELAASPSELRHFNKERMVGVTSFVQTGYNTDKLTDEIMEKLAAHPFPYGYSFIAGGERESAEESFGGMGTIILIAVFGLLAILVLEFRTFKSTLIVLSVIPLGIIGALGILFLIGETLSFVATIGMIALVGIEIKNSILLVDYTNQLREEGMPLEEAILVGAETRFLPILLTTVTAIGGLIPLVLESSPLISPLAWVLIGGLISSTLLSRIVTPLLYKLLPPAVTVREVEL
jgi:multidrug efflux pump subunit AcrB